MRPIGTLIVGRCRHLSRERGSGAVANYKRRQRSVSITDCWRHGRYQPAATDFAGYLFTGRGNWGERDVCACLVGRPSDRRSPKASYRLLSQRWKTRHHRPPATQLTPWCLAIRYYIAAGQIHCDRSLFYRHTNPTWDQDATALRQPVAFGALFRDKTEPAFCSVALWL